MPLPAPAATNPHWIWLPLPPRGPAEPVARAWLGEQLGCEGDALPIHRDRHGRPRLAEPFGHWDCNWSHSGSGLLVALAAGVRLGVDMEWPRPRPRVLALARRFFHGSEADWVAGLAQALRERAFLRLWCAKEAVLKAHGQGLSFGLDRVVFASDGDGNGLRMLHCDPALGSPVDWQLRELVPAPGYLGAMAWQARSRDQR